MTLEAYFKLLTPLITTLIYGLVILNSVRLVSSRRPVSSIFAWIFFMLILPILALPLYYAIGQSRMRGYVQRRKRSEREYSSRSPTPEGASRRDGTRLTTLLHNLELDQTASENQV